MNREESKAYAAGLRARKAELEATVRNFTLDASEREAAGAELSTVLDGLSPLKMMQRMRAET